MTNDFEDFEGFEFLIEDSHFKYLSIQRGEVAEFTNDKKAWKQEFTKNLLGVFESFSSFLPRTNVKNVLEVGSGLGAMAVVASYKYPNAKFHLIDGENDIPQVSPDSRTYSNKLVAEDFLTLNEVKKFQYTFDESQIDPKVKFDLIMSFSSYCFHYRPEEYIEFINRHCKRSTVLVFDVRRDRGYEEILDLYFDVVDIVEERKKFRRMVFKPKAKKATK